MTSRVLQTAVGNPPHGRGARAACSLLYDMLPTEPGSSRQLWQAKAAFSMRPRNGILYTRSPMFVLQGGHRGFTV